MLFFQFIQVLLFSAIIFSRSYIDFCHRNNIKVGVIKDDIALLHYIGKIL